MDHPDLTVSNLVGISICTQMVKLGSAQEEITSRGEGGGGGGGTLVFSYICRLGLNDRYSNLFLNAYINRHV